MQATFLDITERKQAENEIRELNESLEQRVPERTAELRASEERHRSLLRSSPDPIVVYDMEGKAIYVNPALSQAFGWSLDSMYQKSIPMRTEWAGLVFSA